MRVLFVVDHFSIVEPMGVLQLSAILKARGHETRVCALEEGKALDVIAAYRPEAVACSFMTTEAGRVGEFVRDARRLFPRTIIIAGGPHPTYSPRIIDSWPLDALVVGEGDPVIVPLLESLCQGRSVRSLPNVHTKDFKNPQGDLVGELDDLPFPDRELLAHEDAFRSIPMKSFFASRGCPYNCSYCFNSAFNAMHKGKGKILRRRSVENLIREIEQVKARYRMDFLRFGDDNFVMGYDAWTEEFVEKYRSRVGVRFYCLINPNLVDEQLVMALKSAGCHSVMIGIESGSEAVRRKVLGRHMSDQTLKEAFRLFRKYGIRVFSNTILGLPETGLQEDLESMEFTLDCRPHLLGVHGLHPLPRNRAGRLCAGEGLPEDREPVLRGLARQSAVGFGPDHRDRSPAGNSPEYPDPGAGGKSVPPAAPADHPASDLLEAQSLLQFCRLRCPQLL